MRPGFVLTIQMRLEARPSLHRLPSAHRRRVCVRPNHAGMGRVVRLENKRNLVKGLGSGLNLFAHFPKFSFDLLSNHLHILVVYIGKFWCIFWLVAKPRVASYDF